MKLYSATLRMIGKTKAEAEWWAKQYTKDFPRSCNDDGTIQITVEEVDNIEHLQVTPEIMASMIDDVTDDEMPKFLSEYINSLLDIAANQGVGSQIRNAVKFPFQE